MTCNEAVAALVASLESGSSMTEEQRTHLLTCERCRELFDSAKQFQNTLSGNGISVPSVEPALAAAEEEARRRRFRQSVKVFVTLGAVVALIFLFVPITAGLAFGERLMVLVMALLISAGFAVPLIAVILLTRGTSKRPPWYKRLGPGRMISGVALGVSEQIDVSVNIVRLIFVALLFIGGGIGFWLYVLLAVAMPVHPEDRQYMLRFRLRRWWKGRTHAEHHAG
jgi:phage shock protein C